MGTRGLMAKADVGALLVTGENSTEYTGIFTERDYMRRVALDQDKNPWEIKVKEVMTGEVMYVTNDTSAIECMHLMTQKYRRRYLPVKDRRGMSLISSQSVI